MGVFDVCGQAITGGLDHVEMRAIPDALEDRIKRMPIRIQVEKDGQLIDVQGELLGMVEQIRAHIDAIEELQVHVLMAL